MSTPISKLWLAARDCHNGRPRARIWTPRPMLSLASAGVATPSHSSFGGAMSALTTFAGAWHASGRLGAVFALLTAHSEPTLALFRSGRTSDRSRRGLGKWPSECTASTTCEEPLREDRSCRPSRPASSTHPCPDRSGSRQLSLQTGRISEPCSGMRIERFRACAYATASLLRAGGHLVRIAALTGFGAGLTGVRRRWYLCRFVKGNRPGSGPETS